MKNCRDAFNEGVAFGIFAGITIALIIAMILEVTLIN